MDMPAAAAAAGRGIVDASFNPSPNTIGSPPDWRGDPLHIEQAQTSRPSGSHIGGPAVMCALSWVLSQG